MHDICPTLSYVNNNSYVHYVLCLSITRTSVKFSDSFCIKLLNLLALPKRQVIQNPKINSLIT